MTRDLATNTQCGPAAPSGIYDLLERQAETALGRNPGDVAARVALAELLCGRGEYRRAFVHFHQALTQAPDDARLLGSLARACRDLGEEESYHNLMGRLRRIDPNHLLVRAAARGPEAAGGLFQGHQIHEINH